jgi:multidrug resistance protein, MATE family
MSSENEPLIEKEPTVPSTWQTLTTIFKVSIWPVIGFLFHPVYTIVNAATCGRLGPNDLAGFGLGSLTLGILLISVTTCFCMSVSTVVSQAAGAKDFWMCRVYLNRQYYLNCLIFPVLCVPLIFIREIYSAIGQDDDVAHLASRYVWIVMPGVFFSTQALTDNSFAQSMGKTSLSIYMLGISALSHIAMVALFVSALDMGFTGICLATSLQFVVRNVVSYIYVNYNSALRN